MAKFTRKHKREQVDLQVPTSSCCDKCRACSMSALFVVVELCYRSGAKTEKLQRGTPPQCGYTQIITLLVDHFNYGRKTSGAISKNETRVPCSEKKICSFSWWPPAIRASTVCIDWELHRFSAAEQKKKNKKTFRPADVLHAVFNRLSVPRVFALPDNSRELRQFS